MPKKQTTYIDGFVIVVPKEKLAEYRKMAEVGKRVWLKHGALDYKECVGDDLQPTFLKMAKVKSGETVWVSYIEYESKKHRDQVNAKVMKDPAMNDPRWKDKPMPFDMKRVSYGGFKVAVSK